MQVFRGFERVFRGFSEALSEPLSECHFPLRVAGPVAPNRPKGPNLENFQSHLKFPISLENFNPDLQNSPHKIGVWWVARLKISISLGFYFNLWALRACCRLNNLEGV